MQEKRNKRLAVLFLALLAVVVVLFVFQKESGQMDIDRDIFAYDDPSQIDLVSIDLGDETIALQFDGTRWLVNETYTADPQRVKVLFAVLKQMRVRRAAANQQLDSLSNAMDTGAQHVTFYSSGQQVHDFEVLGDASRGITYMTQNQEDIYLVEIPGYRSYLAGIFEVDQQGWRDPLVFDINWRNIQAVHMIYPNKPESSFDVSFNDGEYSISQLQATDTTKLFDLLDEVSLLYVNDFLNNSELSQYATQADTAIATIALEDVGGNFKTLEILGEIEGQGEYLVKKDSSDLGLIDARKLRTVLRPRRFFQMPKN